MPFVGQAGKLLEKLLNGIGLSRTDVYIANVLKCRPPGNRDPQPEEIEACESHLFRQIELIRPDARGHARQLRDEAALRQADRDHARARRPAAGDARRQRRDALPALPSGRGALHALDARRARSGLRPDPGAARAARRPGEPVRARAGAASRSRPSACTSRPCSSASSSSRWRSLLLARGDRGGRRTARGGPRPGRRRHRLGRARLRQDDLRPRRLPRARRDRAGDEPDVHDRPPLRGRPGRLAPRPLPLHGRLARPSGRDLEPYFDDAVVFVEWPEAGAAGLPAVRAAVRLEHDSPTSRVLRIEAEPELLARVAT